ncbi:MAG: hypothetical protein LBD15_04055 [Holosporales bacterium]|nr:hypothetical protein [Holosporales bacterium]
MPVARFPKTYRDRDRFAVILLPSSFCQLLEKARKASLTLKTGCCSAPANIALVKYWGKEPGCCQVPLNSSLSFTLGGFRSHTIIQPAASSFFLDGRLEVLPARMQETLEEIMQHLGQKTALRIESANTFPAACGIASSASGGAALIGAISDALRLSDFFSEKEHTLWLTEGARLFSGSATRSVLPAAFVLWERIPDSFNTKTHAIRTCQDFQSLAHGVVMLDQTEKAISSSQGHKEATTSPLFPLRHAALPFVLKNTQEALLQGDWLTLEMHAEHEAFALHAITQTTKSPVCYLSNATTTFLATFIAERYRQNLRALWTIDAGPNVHLLCPQQELPALKAVLQTIAHDLYTSITVLFNNASDFIAIGADQIATLPSTLIRQEVFAP